MRVARQLILTMIGSLVILTTALSVTAQEAVLLDEFDHVPPCEEMLARLDNLYIYLYNRKVKKGLVVISGSDEYLIDKLRMEMGFGSGGRYRGMKNQPVTVVRGTTTGNAKMQFWAIPDGALAPVNRPTEWDLKLPKGTKPFYFHSDYDNTCGYPMVYPVLKELIAANPHLRINAVVSQRNPRGYRNEVKEIRKTLGPASKGRIRFFRSKDTYTLGTEFWLLP